MRRRAEGRIDWDGVPAPAEQTHNPKLRLDPLHEVDNPTSAALDATGVFHLAKVSPDRYNSSVEGMPEDVFVKSIRLGRREMPDRILGVRRGATGEPLSLVLSAAGAELSGSVHDAEGPLLGAAVGLVEDLPGGFNTIRMVRTGAEGVYTIRGLAPGSYKIFLLDHADFDALLQTGALGIYEQSAAKIELHESDKLSHDLRQ